MVTKKQGHERNDKEMASLSFLLIVCILSPPTSCKKSFWLQKVELVLSILHSYEPTAVGQKIEKNNIICLLKAKIIFLNYFEANSVAFFLNWNL